MSERTLVVPVELEALVVNKGVISRDTFRGWSFSYEALTKFMSPEPEAMDRLVGGQAQGVYLHWTLPRALRHGRQDPKTGEITYPLVPNRWLVVRYSGRQQRNVKAWIVESDCPYSGQVKWQGVERSSPYLVDAKLVDQWRRSSDPFRQGASVRSEKGVQIANIGVAFPLEAGWSERAAADPQFLTAVAPGNPTFSIFTPHNKGVFSFYDDLAGIDDDSLSYMVVGWYANPAADPLAGGEVDLAEAFGWSVTDGAASDARRSLYQGICHSLTWSRNGNPPDGDPLEEIRQTGRLNVAIGNTTFDAFTALIDQQLRARGYQDEVVRLLRAFQYDLLPVINEANGDALLERRIHEEWFGSRHGGYRWRITQRDGKEAEESAPLTPEERSWLQQLNQDQAALDEGLRTLFDLQWRLNALWWKLGRNPDGMWPKKPGVSNKELERELNPANPDSTAAKLLQQVDRVSALTAKLPQADRTQGLAAEEALEKGIEAFARAKGLAPEKQLKAVAAPRYWMANNPVIVVAGVEPPTGSNLDERLTLRGLEQLVTGFTVSAQQIDAQRVGGTLPTLPQLDRLPAGMAELLVDCFFLDPAGSAAIAGATGIDEGAIRTTMLKLDPSAYRGLIPTLGLKAWRQPWSPMFVEWKVNYTHLPYESGTERNWRFDGQDYYLDLGGRSMSVQGREVGGVSLLSPHAQFLFGARLKKFVEQYGSESQLGEIYDWIDQVSGWQFLAQELVGFHDLLALRDPRAFRRPQPDEMVGEGANRHAISDLIGYTGALSSRNGQIDTVPYLPNGPKLDFHGMREGQIYFKDLFIYDKFGRNLHVIQSNSGAGLHDAQNFPLIRDPALYVDQKLDRSIAAPAQVPPRLLQHGRLNFELGEPDQPIAAWVLPNHLDHGLLLFAPDGTALGEFRLLADRTGQRRGQWQGPPGVDMTYEELATRAPLLGQILDSGAIRDEAAFHAFMNVIDSTLWTTDPLGDRKDDGLSVLIGRPLALVRARLQFELEGEALRETGWDATLNPPEPAFIHQRFAIRLGDQATRDDGLIGYFQGAEFTRFNSVAHPSSTLPPQGFVKQIGPPGRHANPNYIELPVGGGSAVELTLLVDPRAGVHATTGLLPAKRVSLDRNQVEQALAALQASFRLGPLLTQIEPTPAQGDAKPAFEHAVRFPIPAEQGGTWSWWERSEEGWNGYEILGSTPEAQFRGGPNTLRDGILRLLINLKPGDR